MNRIYKVIWSKVKHQYVVVSELAHSNGKQSRTARKSLRSRIAALVVCGAIAAFGTYGALPTQQAFAANMPNDISFGFFLKLTELPISNLVISMSKYMLKLVNFDVLCRVCTYFHNSAGNDNETTTILIKSLIPNSIRFYGSDKHFENFLKALIKSIPEGSSLEKQEEILDIILMTNRYFLNPQNEKLREDLIATMNANKATLPRIRSALATNFMK